MTSRTLPMNTSCNKLQSITHPLLNELKTTVLNKQCRDLAALRDSNTGLNLRRVEGYPNYPRGRGICPTCRLDISTTGCKVLSLYKSSCCQLHWSCMAVQLERGVDFPMVDLANIAYYPRIFDLAHRFLRMHGYLFATFVMPIFSWFERRFPSGSRGIDFHAPLRYGDTITATIGLKPLATHRVHGAMNFTIKTVNCFGHQRRSRYVSIWTL